MTPLITPLSTPSTTIPDRFLPVRLADLSALGQIERRWIWRGYVAPGQVTLLTSQWKSGKSTLVSVLLAKMKAGGDLAGFPVAPGRAVVVTEEGPDKWYERSRHLTFGDHLTWFCRPFVGKPTHNDWLQLLDQIARIHDREGLDLVVVDPLANLSPLRSENDASEMLNTLLPLQRLTTRGVAILLPHHPRKGALISGQAARGSGALPGYADIIIEMQRASCHKLKDRRRRLRAFSRHDVTPTSWLIELNSDGTDYQSLGPSAEPDFENGWPMLKTILEQSVNCMDRHAIFDEWPAGPARPTKVTLWRWLKHAVRLGTILQSGKGSRKDPHRYWLPGMENRWIENLTARIMKDTQEPAPHDSPVAEE